MSVVHIQQNFIKSISFGILLVLILALVACATPPPSEPVYVPAEPTAEEKVIIVTEQASCDAVEDRARWLDETVKLLQEDLSRAEGTLIAMESGLKAGLSRADAVAGLAEAKLKLEEAEQAATWRKEAILIAKAKLEEADQQIADGHYAAAIFFVYRVKRIAGDLMAEAKRIRDEKDVSFVQGERVNLRSGPGKNREVIAVLSRGTPVFRVETKDGWVLVRTTHGQAGWIFQKLIS